MEKVTHKAIANAILKKMCKENNVDIDNVFISQFGYVETVDINKKDVDFCKTEYNGVQYEVRYIGGCFNPFIVYNV